MINWLTNAKPLKAFGMVLGLLILSYLFVHIFAVLGIFLALGFPLLWLLFPQFTTCIYCRNTPTGKKCPSCRQIVDVTTSPPKNIRSLAINSLTIVFLSAVSIGAIYLEYKFLEQYSGMNNEEKLVEFLIPEQRQYKIGEIFPVDLEINTNGVSINAVQADIAFDKEIAQIVKVSLEKSFSQIFIQNEVNNENGYARLTGGLPNPGFSGESGHFSTIYFKAKRAGLLEIIYLPSSLVLANNGDGTNILKSYPTINYLIRPEYISETQEEIQDSVYYSNVLGVTSNDDQILLFDEDEENVLGVESTFSYETPNRRSENRNSSTKDIIYRIDHWIMEFLKSIISLFRK